MNELESRLIQEANESSQKKRWQSPTIFNLSEGADREHLSELMNSGEVRDVFDASSSIAEDIFLMNHPDQKSNESEKQRYISQFVEQGIDNPLLRRVYYPWDSSLVTFPDESLYRELKTFRYRNLITDEEQQKINMGRIAICGLSVGSHIALALAENGIGNAMALYDFDDVSVPNLGRMHATMSDVGRNKADVAAMAVHKIDPYISLTVGRQGFSDNTSDELDDFNPTVVFDEVDHMPTAAKIRRYAQSRRRALLSVSDVDTNAVLDIRRHDTQAVKNFSGWISDEVTEAMAKGELSDSEQDMVFVKSVGVDKLSFRLLQSVVEIDKSLGGIPQIGSTALVGAGLAAQATREILTGSRLPDSGMYTIRGGRVLKLKTKADLSEIRSTLVKFKNR